MEKINKTRFIIISILFVLLIISIVYSDIGLHDDFTANEGTGYDSIGWVSSTFEYYIEDYNYDDMITWDLDHDGNVDLVWIKTGKCSDCLTYWEDLSDYCTGTCGSDNITCSYPLASPGTTLGYIDDSSVIHSDIRAVSYSCNGSYDFESHNIDLGVTIGDYYVINDHYYDCGSCNWKYSDCDDYDYKSDDMLWYTDIYSNIACSVNTECDKDKDEVYSYSRTGSLSSPCRTKNSYSCSNNIDCLVDICYSDSKCGIPMGGSTCNDDYDCRNRDCESSYCRNCIDDDDCSGDTPYCDDDGSAPGTIIDYDCGCWNRNSPNMCDECLNEGISFLCDCDNECDSGRCDIVCYAKLANGQPCDENSDCINNDCDSGTCNFDDPNVDIDVLPLYKQNCTDDFVVDISGSSADTGDNISLSCFSYTGGVYYDDCISQSISECNIKCPYANWIVGDWDNSFSFNMEEGKVFYLFVKLVTDYGKLDTSSYELCNYCYPNFCGETCDDGILNMNEITIDCGGICGDCSNGILDYFETEIDYGGYCGTCDDDERNYQCGEYLETISDYGGHCGTCDDGLTSSRLGETYVDYGGYCGNCYNNILDVLINETEIDYGGYYCGSCIDIENKTLDNIWLLSKSLDKSIPFDEVWCEQGQASLIAVSFFLFLLIITGLIMFLGVLFIVIFVIVTNLGVIITTVYSFHTSYKMIKNVYKNKDKSRKELVKEAWKNK